MYHINDKLKYKLKVTFYTRSVIRVQIVSYFSILWRLNKWGKYFNFIFVDNMLLRES